MEDTESESAIPGKTSSGWTEIANHYTIFELQFILPVAVLGLKASKNLWVYPTHGWSNLRSMLKSELTPNTAWRTVFRGHMN